MTPIKARTRPREVEVELLTNGNWLVVDGERREVVRAQDFSERYEILAPEPRDTEGPGS